MLQLYFTFRLFIAMSLCLFPNFANCSTVSPLTVSEVPDSNRGPKIAIIGVLWFCLVPTGKFGNSIWNQEAIASFHILPNSLFHNRSVADAICSKLLASSLTLNLLMSYICGVPCKARNFNVVYIYIYILFIWTYVWQRWKPSLSIYCTLLQHWINAESYPVAQLCINTLLATKLTLITDRI
jgi:hypothetical protein